LSATVERVGKAVRRGVLGEDAARDALSAGMLGRKSGRGLYSYV
jgi:3-hydroxyacyl-CoA dehydrogenase